LAVKTIEALADKSRSASEHACAKRRLIHGPKEFRDIRADQPRRRKWNEFQRSSTLSDHHSHQKIAQKAPGFRGMLCFNQGE